MSLALPRLGGVSFKGVPAGDRMAPVAPSVRVSCGGQMGPERRSDATSSKQGRFPRGGDVIMNP